MQDVGYTCYGDVLYSPLHGIKSQLPDYICFVSLPMFISCLFTHNSSVLSVQIWCSFIYSLISWANFLKLSTLNTFLKGNNNNNECNNNPFLEMHNFLDAFLHEGIFSIFIFELYQVPGEVIIFLQLNWIVNVSFIKFLKMLLLGVRNQSGALAELWMNPQCPVDSPPYKKKWANP